MPALRMKTKIIIKSSEGHSLGVCHKPPKASKNSSCYHFKASKQACILDNFQGSRDVTSKFESSDRISKLTEVDSRNSHSGPSDQNSDFPSESLDSVHVGSQSVPILETIFSPIIEYSEANSSQTNYRDAGLYDAHSGLPRLIDENDDGFCNTNPCQSFELSDCFTSDLCPILPFDGGIGFSDLINIDSSEYDHINSGLTFDIDRGCMIFPFSEKKLGNLRDDSSDDELVTVDESVLFLAVPQLEQPKCGAESSFHSREGGEYDCFDPHMFFGNLPDTSEAISPLHSMFLTKETWKRKSVTLVLDLDETLVHSCLEHCDSADFTFSVLLNNEEHTVYVRQRPYLHTFLERVAQMFEVVIFTASQSIYAAQLVDKLDPNKNLISKRIYRESCTFYGGIYTKDLTILGIDLAKVAIIDNSPQVFQLQVNNGIPIESWFDDPTDCALISLLPFLETLVDADDVRPLITKFNNKEQ